MDIPGYKIERELGRGGMAVVYLAVQEALGRPVALKVMSRPPTGDADLTLRFLREGKTVAHLAHSNIIKVFDTGVYRDQYYLSMEYLRGGTLKERIQRGLDKKTILVMLRALGDALAYAHRHGVIHRDIKSQNILLYSDDTPVLSDFGIAKALSSDTVMTASGAIIGSPRYMSPEQIRGQAIDARTDLYALGILLHEMLTGEVPYVADDSFAIAYKHIHDPIPRLADEFADFQPLLDKLLAKQPAERFASAEAFLDALQTLETQQHLVDSGALHIPGKLRGRSDAKAPAEAKKPRSARASGTPDREQSSHGKVWLLSSAAGLAALAAAAGGYFYTEAQRQAEWQRQQQAAQQAETLRLAQAEQERLARQQTLAAQAEQERLARQQTLAAQAEQERLARQRSAEEQAQRQRDLDRFIAAAQRQQADGELEASLTNIDKALQIDPQSQPMLALRQQVIAQLAQTVKQQRELERRLRQARQLLGEGDLPAAQQRIEQGLQIDPGHSDLLALRDELHTEQAAQQRRQALAELSAQARQQLSDNDFDASLRSIDKALEIDPQSDELLALRQQVQSQQAEDQRQRDIQRTVQRARQYLDQGELQASLQQIDQGLEIDPDASILLSLRREVEQRQAERREPSFQVLPIDKRYDIGDYVIAVREQPSVSATEIGELHGSITVTGLVTHDDNLWYRVAFADHTGFVIGADILRLAHQAKQRENTPPTQPAIDRLLALAERQLADKKLTTPAGDNAYDTYQEIQALAPEHPGVERGLAAIAERYFDWAAQRKQYGQYKNSLRYIDKGLQVMPQHSGLAQLRDEVLALQQKRIQSASKTSRGRTSAKRPSAAKPPAAAREPEPATRPTMRYYNPPAKSRESERRFGSF